MFLANVSRVDSNQSNDNGTVERRKTLIAATLRRAAARATERALGRFKRTEIIDVCGRPLQETGHGAGGGCDDPDRKSTRLNSSHVKRSRMPSSA